MTTEIKELVKRFRDAEERGWIDGGSTDALETLAGEVERLRKEVENSDAEANHWHDNCIAEQRGPNGYPVFWEWRAKAAEAERDRLKAALETIAASYHPGAIIYDKSDGTWTAQHTIAIHCAIARKALGDES